MKRYLTTVILILGFGITTNAQTAIGKKTVSTASVLLDFSASTTKGIILPAVETLPTSPANGTFVLDRNDRKIKMRQPSVWIELSESGSIASLVPYSGTSDNTRKTVMGARESGANGVLVLESTNKALVLPHVANPHSTVKSPYPGMMCYDTVKKALAVFDGSVWNYWK